MLKSHGLHQFARALAPFLAVPASIAGTISLLLCIDAQSPITGLLCAAGGLALTVLSGFLPGIVLRRLPVACPKCGGPSYARDRKRPENFRCSACGDEYASPFRPGNLLLGLLVVGLGLTVSGLAFGLKDVEWGGRLFLCLFGLMWVAIGLFVTGWLGMLMDRLSARVPLLGRIPWAKVVVVLATFGIGSLIMLASVFDTREDAFPSGRPAAFVGGLVFFLAGVAIMMPSFFRGNENTTAQTVAGSLLITAMLGVPVLIAAGGGALPLLASAAVLGGLAILAWRAILRRLVPRKSVRIAIGVAVLLGFGALVSVLARRSQPPPAAAEAYWKPEPVTFELSSPTVAAGGELTIRFDRKLTWPEDWHYWITVAEASSEHGAYGSWQYIARGTEELTVTVPDRSGSYEVRLHPTLSDVLYELPLEIVERADVPSLPAELPPEGELPAEAEDPGGAEGEPELP